MIKKVFALFKQFKENHEIFNTPTLYSLANEKTNAWIIYFINTKTKLKATDQLIYNISLV